MRVEFLIALVLVDIVRFPDHLILGVRSSAP